MVGGLIYFLIGVLVLVICLYVVKLVLDQLTLPPNVRQIALVIVGLIGLIVLLYLAFGALARPGPVVWP